uniref:Uncharacterized protein n=1 Tax=viral metagenome TaxID=1070528 RepID=A0A6M3L2T3_9ZZZZ
MAKKLNHQLKEEVIDALRYHGTMQYAAKACNVSVRTLNEEMRRSSIFKSRVLEARAEGKTNIADRAIELIKSYAYGENTEKTDRNRLTAAIALANAYEPGFRGTTQVQGRIDHDVRVITAVPRPKYKVEIENKPQKLLDKPKDKGYNSVEEVIEGEVINE